MLNESSAVLFTLFMRRAAPRHSIRNLTNHYIIANMSMVNTSESEVEIGRAQYIAWAEL